MFKNEIFFVDVTSKMIIAVTSIGKNPIMRNKCMEVLFFTVYSLTI